MYKLRNLLLACVILSSFSAALPGASHVDESGLKLKQYYLSLNVENLWMAGQHINWETGQANDENATHNIKTHCSAFVAAACKRLGIYILRPPAHKQVLLANAQYDWLETSEATSEGWREITGDNRYEMAQAYANDGYVVVAITKNLNPHKPGHTALIMPTEMWPEKLAEYGPTLIMAGTKNYNSISLRAGFKHHLNGWPENVIRFYYNELKPSL